MTLTTQTAVTMPPNPYCESSYSDDENNEQIRSRKKHCSEARRPGQAPPFQSSQNNDDLILVSTKRLRGSKSREHGMNERLEEMKARLQDMEKQLRTAISLLTENEELTALMTKFKNLEADLSSERAKCSTAVSQQSALQADLDRAKVDRDSAISRQATLKAVLAKIGPKSRLAVEAQKKLDTALTKAKSELDSERASHATDKADLQNERSQRADLAGRLRDAQRQLDDFKAQHSASLARTTADLPRNPDAELARVMTLEVDLAAERTLRSNVSNRLDDARHKLDDARAGHATELARVKTLENDLAAERRRHAETADCGRHLERQVFDAEARLATELARAAALEAELAAEREKLAADRHAAALTHQQAHGATALAEEQGRAADLRRRLDDAEARGAAALADGQLRRDELERALAEERAHAAALERQLGDAQTRGAAALAEEQDRAADLRRRLRVALGQRGPEPSQAVVPSSQAAQGEQGGGGSIEERLAVMEARVTVIQGRLDFHERFRASAGRAVGARLEGSEERLRVGPGRREGAGAGAAGTSG
jgi:hypothetical protein